MHTVTPTSNAYKTYTAKPNAWRSQANDDHYRDWVDEQSLDMASDAFDAFANARLATPCTECGCTHKSEVTA